MTPLDVLRDTREFLSDPARWTKGTAARDANGDPCEVEYEHAKSFCLLGATLYTTLGRPSLFDRTKDYLSYVLDSPLNLRQLNDNPATTHEEILALLDRAIAFAEPQP